jgi:anti-anti-sigma factor
MGPSVSPAGELSSQSASALPESSKGCALGMRVEEQGSTLLLGLTGEFDRADVGRVEAALDRVAAQTTRVVFDLQGLSFLDAGGLMAILRAHERARTEPFELVVVRPQGLASRIFTLTRAGEQLTIVDDIPPTDARPSVPTRFARRRSPEPLRTPAVPLGSGPRAGSAPS